MSAYDELMQKQAAFTTTPGYMEKQALRIPGLKRMYLKTLAKARRALRSYSNDVQEVGKKIMDEKYKFKDTIDLYKKHPVLAPGTDLAMGVGLPYGAVKAWDYITGGDEEEQPPTPAPAPVAAKPTPAPAAAPKPMQAPALPDADPMAKQSAYNALMNADQVLASTPGYMEKQSFSFLKNLGRRAIDLVDDKLVDAMARRPKTVATMAAMGGVGLPVSLMGNASQWLENYNQGRKIEKLQRKADALDQIVTAANKFAPKR